MAKLKDGFYKLTAETVGSNSYMLLAGGGSKALSDFATASGVVTALGTNGNYVTWTKNGTANNLTVPYATNADTVDGYHVTKGNNKPWGTIPAITAGGYMDVGKHFEFHYDNTTGSDYSTALMCTGNHGNVVNLPSTSGTLALISQIPTSLPANGGNADTVDNLHASDFEAYKCTVIDTTGLNENTWYPVTFEIGCSLQTRIRVEGRTSTTGSWNNRSDKYMAVLLDYVVQGSTWGWISPTRIVYDFELGAGAGGTNCVAGLGLLTNSSTEYVYVRGGAKYNFYISRFITPVLRTTSYTVSSQTIAPTTTSPTAITINNALKSDLTWSNVSDKPSFATVATSGSYNDLSNRPTIPTVTNYYWANVKVSSSSNEATTPTFSTIATTSPSYVATLRPAATTTYFLGSSEYRWNNVFSYLGNFSGQITSSVAVGTAPFKITSTTVNANLNADMVDGKHASDFAAASHSHSYLPLSGGTMTGPITMNTSNYIYGVCEDSGAMLFFDGTRAVIGSVGASSTASTHIRTKDSVLTIGSGNTASYTVLHSGNSNVSGGGSSWGSSITVKINNTTATLTIPSNPNTWRGITDSYSGTDSTTSLSQKGGNALYNALLNGYASSAGNADTVDNYHIVVTNSVPSSVTTKQIIFVY